MSTIPYTSDTVNKIYQETQDFITDIQEQIEQQDKENKERFDKNQEINKRWADYNLPFYNQLEKIRKQEIARIRKLPAFNFYIKLNLLTHAYYLSDDFYLCSKASGSCGPEERIDLVEKFCSEDYKLERDKIYDKIKDRKYFE